MADALINATAAALGISQGGAQGWALNLGYSPYTESVYTHTEVRERGTTRQNVPKSHAACNLC